MEDRQVSIIYNKFCPYAQRALITAIEKDLQVTFVKTGLGEQTKTKFFSEAYGRALGRDPSSNGKVPVLIHGDRYITESQLVCWYMAENFSTGSLLIPDDAFKKMKMRIWIDRINVELISIFDRAKLKRIGVLEDFIKEIEGFLERV